MLSRHEDVSKIVQQEQVDSPAKYILPIEDCVDVSLVGGKALNLGVLKRAGLPIPNAFGVTTEAYDYYVREGQLPPGLVDHLIQISDQLGRKVAIRSSANCEDGSALSMAGVFETHFVPEEMGVQEAVEKIYRQARSQEVKDFASLHCLNQEAIKMGVVVQKLIEPEVSGVIYTTVGENGMLIQYVNGFGSKLADGETRGSALLLDKSTGIIIESAGFEQRPISSEALSRILEPISGVEAIFGGRRQDVEFAVQDGEMFVLQSRDLTTEIGEVVLEETPEETLENIKSKLKSLAEIDRKELGIKRAVFSDSNFIELLPKPAEMDIGIFAHIFTGANGNPGAIQLGRIQMGYPLGHETDGFMYYIGGRPYFSLARDAGTFYAGFPDTREEYYATFVRDYLDAVEADPSKGIDPEIYLYVQDPTMEELQRRFGPRSEEYYQTYLHFLQNIEEARDYFVHEYTDRDRPQAEQFIRDIRLLNFNAMDTNQLVSVNQVILEHLRLVSCVHFVKAARLAFYYSQRLKSELKKYSDSEETAKQIFGSLTTGLEGSSVTDVGIFIEEARSDEEALVIARERIWHYSTGEGLQIRHQRLKDDETALAAYVRVTRELGKTSEGFKERKQKRLETQKQLLEALPEEERERMEKIIVSCQTYSALRETVKYMFTQEYGLSRDILEVIENRLGLDKGDIYHLYPQELQQLIADPKSMLHIIKSRRVAFNNYREIELPHVITEVDIDKLTVGASRDNDSTEFKGKFLAEGEAVEGVVVNVDDFQDISQVGDVIGRYRREEIPVILVAAQMNLGHDPYIAASNGLVLENAGIVSHGAQRARELGKGAIGGIKSRYLKTGTKIYFDPSNRTVRRI